MAELNKMYKGVVNSPGTYLREPLASGGSIIYVIDGSVLGELPNIAVIGNDQTAETVLVKNVRSDGGYDVDRAVEGNAKDWPQMTTVARNFTNYDYEQIRQNLGILNTTKAELIDGKVNPAQLPADKDTTYTAGTNVQINTGNVISATDTKYTAGTNVSISGTTISATDTKYTAGTNVTISGNTISATDTTYGVATTSSNGLMASSDKTKLNGIEAGAQKNSVTSVQGRTGAVTISKSDVGLGSVNNVAITAAQVTKINELNYTRALTEAQYNALTTTEKNRTDVWYGIYKE